MAKKSKAKKEAVKEPEPESEVCETCGKESSVCEAEEVIEEILEEIPKAEVVEERELPDQTGEETSEVKTSRWAFNESHLRLAAGFTYTPLMNELRKKG